jgi:hypothetical protein
MMGVSRKLSRFSLLRGVERCGGYGSYAVSGNGLTDSRA